MLLDGVVGSGVCGREARVGNGVCWGGMHVVVAHSATLASYTRIPCFIP